LSFTDADGTDEDLLVLSPAGGALGGSPSPHLPPTP
jgi:hypothetical protein